MHLVTHMNLDTIPFVILVQYKGDLSEMEFTISILSNASI